VFLGVRGGELRGGRDPIDKAKEQGIPLQKHFKGNSTFRIAAAYHKNKQILLQKHFFIATNM
jgi:hypothetical protein